MSRNSPARHTLVQLTWPGLLMYNVNYINGVTKYLDKPAAGAQRLAEPNDPPSDETTSPADASAALHAELEAMSPQDRLDFVDRARRCSAWPPGVFLALHAKKWGYGRSADQYASWTQTIKNRPGTEVYAFVHPVHGSKSIAFVNHQEGVVVHVDVDADLNMDTYVPARPTRLWLADQVGRGIYMRLRDTEL